jgi:hypothetical protein
MRRDDAPDPSTPEIAAALEAAMARAVRAALLRHRQIGNPVAVWRNERVEWLPPDEIPVADST